MYPSNIHDHGKYGVQMTSIPITTPTAPGVPIYNTQHMPISPGVRSAERNQWSTGLCHCCDDPENCLITCFCPCITFGQIAEIGNKGTKSCASRGTVYGLLLLTGFACLYSCFYRSKIRGQYNLEEAPCVDCLVHFCCEVCALSQEYRELKNRGFDMGIGWQANIGLGNVVITVAPQVEGDMIR
ncbi:Plant cadmium resistance [Thalictrum thalictroides]|uniref:Plant cadmium resistance n=1 Tax=Thalictrum thalictroides TaxID=46969 RepID=A0A7J6VT98_THATH|nr:Plant cadmium resistance [Thalictrum thalictroides]